MLPSDNRRKFSEKLQLIQILESQKKYQKVNDTGKLLSEMLLQKNGLATLFMALEDLGSEAFWQNSTAITGVAKLLARKPTSVKSNDKYFAFILREFLLLLKQEQWATKLHPFSAILVEEFNAISKLAVQLNIFDRLLHPFAIFAEQTVDQKQTENKLWNKHLDDSLWLLARLLSSFHPSGTFIGHERMQRFLPIWTHLLGQAIALDESNSAEANEKPLQNFVTDLEIIVARTLAIDSNGDTPHNSIKLLFERPTNRIALIEIGIRAKPLVSFADRPSAWHSRYNVAAALRHSPFSRQEVIDFKLSAVKSSTKRLPNQMQFLIGVLDALFERINQSKGTEEEILRFVNTNEGECVHNRDDRQFDGFIPYYVLVHIAEHLTQLELEEFDSNVITEMLRISEIFLRNYIAKLERRNDVQLDVPSYSAKQDDEISKLEVQSLRFVVGLVCSSLLQVPTNDSIALNLLKNAASQMELLVHLLKNDPLKNSEFTELIPGIEEFLKMFRDDLGIDFSKQEKETNRAKGKIQRKSENNSSIDEILTELSTVKDLGEADEMELAMQGHHLVEISRLLRKRDKRAFPGSACFERLYDKLIEMLEIADSFVFMAAINALAELVFWRTDEFLCRMVELFREWRPRGDVPSTSEDNSLMVRYKIGEALAKVLRNLGDFSAHYFDEVANVLFAMTRENKDPMIRASALSSLSDLVMACRGRYFDRHLQELLCSIDHSLRCDRDRLARRAAIQLLRCMVGSAAQRGLCSLLESFSDSLAKITRQLRHLRTHDLDDVVRFQAELAIEDMELTLIRAFNPTI